MKKYCLILLSFLLFSLPAASSSLIQEAHEAYTAKNYQRAGELYEKIYYQDNVYIYLENAQSAYLSYAFNLSNEKEYEKAIQYCHKILLLNPGNIDANELLSEIYYSRGSDNYYKGLKEMARYDFQNSLKHSVLDEQKQRAQKELAKISSNR